MDIASGVYSVRVPALEFTFDPHAVWISIFMVGHGQSLHTNTHVLLYILYTHTHTHKNNNRTQTAGPFAFLSINLDNNPAI